MLNSKWLAYPWWCYDSKYQVKYEEIAAICNKTEEMHIELVCIKIELGYILCVYSPPNGNLDIFLDTLRDAVHEISETGKRTYLHSR